MGPGATGLEQEWGRGVSKPWKSRPEIGGSRVLPPCLGSECPGACSLVPSTLVSPEEVMKPGSQVKGPLPFRSQVPQYLEFLFMQMRHRTLPANDMHSVP